MDVESEYWDEWENRFITLADKARKVPITQNLKGSRHYLCLYGDNGLTPEEEFAELETMAQHPDELKKVEVDTSYWQDTVLFIP